MESEIPKKIRTTGSYGSHSSSMRSPRIIYTDPDDSVPLPAGRIVDDSSRGCLFWEVITKDDQESNSGNNWTSPFKIKWLSPPERSLQFDKIAHLHNPLNDDKPVKIARDGTEIHPDVGKQLIDLFHSI
jgi:hypothetical protein